MGWGFLLEEKSSGYGFSAAVCKLQAREHYIVLTSVPKKDKTKQLLSR